MTGRELIVYILQNNLENSNIFDFLVPVEEVAKRFDVGAETVKVWFKLGLIPGFIIGDTLFCTKDVKDPRSDDIFGGLAATVMDIK